MKAPGVQARFFNIRGFEVTHFSRIIVFQSLKYRYSEVKITNSSDYAVNPKNIQRIFKILLEYSKFPPNIRDISRIFEIFLEYSSIFLEYSEIFTNELSFAEYEKISLSWFDLPESLKILGFPGKSLVYTTVFQKIPRFFKPV